MLKTYLISTILLAAIIAYQEYQSMGRYLLNDGVIRLSVIYLGVSAGIVGAVFVLFIVGRRLFSPRKTSQ
jgi:hypothetical protein